MHRRVVSACVSIYERDLCALRKKHHVLRGLIQGGSKQSRANKQCELEHGSSNPGQEVGRQGMEKYGQQEGDKQILGYLRKRLLKTKGKRGSGSIIKQRTRKNKKFKMTGKLGTEKSLGYVRRRERNG